MQAIHTNEENCAASNIPVKASRLDRIYRIADFIEAGSNFQAQNGNTRWGMDNAAVPKLPPYGGLRKHGTCTF